MSLRVPEQHEIADVLYRKLSKDEIKDPSRPFECRLCPFRPSVNGSGGKTNLASHVRNKHRASYVEAYHDLAQKPTTVLDNFVQVTVNEKALNLYRWMDWIIHERRELTFCEKPRTRRYTTLSPISAKTLKATLHSVEKQVRSAIAVLLRDRPFGLIFDAWTEAGTHYVGVIAVTPSTNDPTKATKYLLSLAPLRDETKLDAEAFVEHFDFVLDRFSLEAKRLCFVVCDHASVNGKLSRDAEVPMIGCASHRLQLAVGRILEPHADLLAKLNELMRRLGTLKNRAKLYDEGAVMPVQRNATRWSSTFAMVKCYYALKDSLDLQDKEIAQVYPSASEELRLDKLFEDLKDLESISKRLQCDTDENEESNVFTAESKKPARRALSLAEVRTLFDGVVKAFPASKEHLAQRVDSTASRGRTGVVKSPDFENGIVKVLFGEEAKLTAKEEAALARLRVTESDREEPEERLSFAERLLKGGVRTKKSKYIDLAWIPATSNEVERLFSRAGLVLSERRRSMHPMTLEILMFLEYNDRLWNANTVAEAMETSAASKKQRIV